MKPTPSTKPARVAVVIAERKKVEMRCSFCRGTGRDPFGIMSWQSACCVCQGSGLVAVETPCTRCTHCGGTGAVKTFTCTACHGKGFVPAASGPIIRCPRCRGSGHGSITSLPCLKCRGRGWINWEFPRQPPDRK